MINRDIAKKISGRFHALQFPPAVEGMKAIIDALAENAQTEDHCHTIVDEIVRNPIRDRDGFAHWPDVAVIIRVAKSTAPPAAKGQQCPHCNGAGWVYQPIRTFDKFAGGVITVDGSRRCVCNGGKAMEEPRDTQRAAAGDREEMVW